MRAMGAYGLPDAMRLTIGTQDANHRVVDVLKKFMESLEND